MSGFFGELRRRKVYRVAAAYIVAGGFIIQIASIVFPTWDLPAWSLRLIIVFILAAFPIALIFAWAFDVTPSGIERTPKVEAQTSGSWSRRRRNVILLGASGLVISIAAGFFVLPRASARKLDKSIAVLPFENLSDDKENAYFADGIQDDILTHLSKIGDLKVISRTSVMSYRGGKHNVREIGKALGVSTILEGSVRRSGNRIRLNVQLIDATNDEHIWANDYDRDLTDVFAIQTDLAQRIANELQAKLSPTEKAMMTRKPTENGEAYLAFVQAHNFHSAYSDLEKLKQGEQLYERAVQLDPKFALALARYSQLESWIIHTFERTAARREKARTLAQRALQLQPDLPEAHLALGFSYYYGDNDYDAAAREFAIAQRGLPNEAEAYLAMGAIQRRQGRWAESTANLEKATILNPKDTWPLQNLAFNYGKTRDFAAANRTLDRGLKIDPNSLELWEIKAKLAIVEKGDFSVAEKGLARFAALPGDPERNNKLAIGRVGLFLLQRNYAEAARAADGIPDDAFANYPGALCTKYSMIGQARKAIGDTAGAREAFLKAKNYAEARVNQSPDDARACSEMAEALAWLGEKEAALAVAKRAAELLPESKDAFDGPEITASLAMVYATTGDTGRALDILDGLLQRPSSISVPLLKVDPLWDSLRSDPRFQALLDKHGGQT